MAMRATKYTSTVCDHSLTVRHLDHQQITVWIMWLEDHVEPQNLPRGATLFGVVVV